MQLISRCRLGLLGKSLELAPGSSRFAILDIARMARVGPSAFLASRPRWSVVAKSAIDRCAARENYSSRCICGVGKDDPFSLAPKLPAASQLAGISNLH
jgi:hypothetical protein